MALSITFLINKLFVTLSNGEQTKKNRTTSKLWEVDQSAILFLYISLKELVSFALINTHPGVNVPAITMLQLLVVVLLALQS